MKNEVLSFLQRYEKADIVNIYRLLKEEDKLVVHYLVENDLAKEVCFVVLNFINNSFDVLFEIRTKYLGASIYNGRTQIDGETEITDYDKKEENRNVVMLLFNNIFLEGASNHLGAISKYISSEKYYQHNIDNKIGDGIEELKKSIIKMSKHNSDLKYDRIIFVLAEGNFVFTISEQDWFNPDVNRNEVWIYFDLFRLENNKIIEHWDILKRK